MNCKNESILLPIAIDYINSLKIGKEEVKLASFIDVIQLL